MSKACQVLWESELIRQSRFGDLFLRDRDEMGWVGLNGQAKDSSFLIT